MNQELSELLERVKGYKMTPEEVYEQCRSFARGMCPFKQDYASWCAEVDRQLPPLGKSQKYD